MSQMAVVHPKKEAQQTLKGMLEKIGPAMSAVLPKHVTPERMIKIALSATNRMPALLDCDAKSIIQAVMLGAELGLEAGGILGEAYLVPYKGKVQLIVGYRGLVKLAKQSGEVADVEARAVFERDFFEFEYGLDQKLRHVPTREQDPGKLVYVYSIARMKDGGQHFDVMTIAEVEKIKNRSPSGRSGPWVSDYVEMAKKTIVRRLCKMIPMSAERLNRALEVSDKADALHAADIDISAGMADDDAPPQMTQGDALKAKLAENERETVTVPAETPSKPGREPGQEGLRPWKQSPSPATSAKTQS